MYIKRTTCFILHYFHIAANRSFTIMTCLASYRGQSFDFKDGTGEVYFRMQIRVHL